MKKINILILCAAGMSSGLIVDSLKKNAIERDLEINVECSTSLNFRQFDYTKLDVVLLAPQIKSQTQDITQYISQQGLNLPCLNIDMRDYGLVKGSIILEKTLKALEIL